MIEIKRFVALFVGAIFSLFVSNALAENPIATIRGYAEIPVDSTSNGGSVLIKGARGTTYSKFLLVQKDQTNKDSLTFNTEEFPPEISESGLLRAYTLSIVSREGNGINKTLDLDVGSNRCTFRVIFNSTHISVESFTGCHIYN